MLRSYALSLGAIAMALVSIRGAMAGELAETVAIESVIALVVFAILGGIAGAVMDYLVRSNLEEQYRRRVAWYRQEREQRLAMKK